LHERHLQIAEAQISLSLTDKRRILVERGKSFLFQRNLEKKKTEGPLSKKRTYNFKGKGKKNEEKVF